MGKAQDIEESPRTKPPGPPKLTFYPASTLGHGDNDVAIYFPNAYVPRQVNLLVYFHGLLDRCNGNGTDTMQTYLTGGYFQLRELVCNSGKNVVLVVPRLRSTRDGLQLDMGADQFLKKVVAHVAAQSRLAFQWQALTPAAMKGLEKLG